MLVRVRYSTGTYDYVSPTSMDKLIQSDAITLFFRSGSWVTIGVDPIRGLEPSAIYDGPERRGVPPKMPSFSVAITKPFLKKGLAILLICLTLSLSTLFGTALSAIFAPPVDELEDPLFILADNQ